MVFLSSPIYFFHVFLPDIFLSFILSSFLRVHFSFPYFLFFSPSSSSLHTTCIRFPSFVFPPTTSSPFSLFLPSFLFTLLSFPFCLHSPLPSPVTSLFSSFSASSFCSFSLSSIPIPFVALPNAHPPLLLCPPLPPPPYPARPRPVSTQVFRAMKLRVSAARRRSTNRREQIIVRRCLPSFLAPPFPFLSSSLPA